MTIEGKTILVTGGTGSLGQRVVRRLLEGGLGRPAKVTVLSRDEAKQHDMRLRFLQRPAATDDVIYQHARDLLAFRIGDVRDYDTLVEAVRHADIVIHAAALKQVPTCEYFPVEAVRTNVLGADALVRATMAAGARVEAVVGISTDKACKPINVMGMTKAVMERILVEANLRQPRHAVCLRALRQRRRLARVGGAAVPRSDRARRSRDGDAERDDALPADARPRRRHGAGRAGQRQAWRDLRAEGAGGPHGGPGRGAGGGRNIPIVYTGIRPGEKVHEIMVSDEECHRTIEREGYYVICPMLPECAPEAAGGHGAHERILVGRHHRSIATASGRCWRPTCRGRCPASCTPEPHVMKVATIVGTRPEIIRLSRVIPLLDRFCTHLLIHTGQNYDPLLSDVFFDDLGVRAPDVHLGITRQRLCRASRRAAAWRGGACSSGERPDRLLVLGDTNSGLAALVAARLGIPVFHMEAGNRCYDDRVPEEINRRVIDHSSTVLMPYTGRSKENLVREGIERERDLRDRESDPRGARPLRAADRRQRRADAVRRAARQASSC